MTMLISRPRTRSSLLVRPLVLSANRTYFNDGFVTAPPPATRTRLGRSNTRLKFWPHSDPQTNALHPTPDTPLPNPGSPPHCEVSVNDATGCPRPYGPSAATVTVPGEAGRGNV